MVVVRAVWHRAISYHEEGDTRLEIAHVRRGWIPTYLGTLLRSPLGVNERACPPHPRRPGGGGGRAHERTTRTIQARANATQRNAGFAIKVGHSLPPYPSTLFFLVPFLHPRGSHADEPRIKHRQGHLSSHVASWLIIDRS